MHKTFCAKGIIARWGGGIREGVWGVDNHGLSHPIKGGCLSTREKVRITLLCEFLRLTPQVSTENLRLIERLGNLIYFPDE